MRNTDGVQRRGHVGSPSGARSPPRRISRPSALLRQSPHYHLNLLLKHTSRLVGGAFPLQFVATAPLCGSPSAIAAVRLSGAAGDSLCAVFPSPPRLVVADWRDGGLVTRAAVAITHPAMGDVVASQSAATLLREHGFSRDVVELLLAHAERNKVTAAYHHHEMAEERRRALQYLADQIERLAAATAATASAEPPTASRQSTATA